MNWLETIVVSLTVTRLIIYTEFYSEFKELFVHYEIHFHFLFCRFDYGEKFWVIKHKFFTCHCASDRCRYSKSNITSFLREYYKRSGEPLPPELSSETNGSSPVKEAKKENSPTVVIPLTKVNVKALTEETTIKKEIGSTEDNSSKNTPSRPRRSVTRKSAASEEAAAAKQS